MAHIIGSGFSDDLDGTNSDDRIEGRGGDDRLWGYAGDDLLIGGSGHDDLDGGTGADRMEGGTGDDYYFVDSTGDQVVELPGEGIDTVFTDLGAYTLGANVEDLVVVSSLDFRGVGNALDNYIYGYTGNDVLDGDAGDDVMFGHLGDDIFFVDDSGDEVVEYAGEGYDTVFTSLAALTLAANVEELIFDGSGAFHGIGNGRDNMIEGGAGNDRLEGRGGSDRLEGRDGDDLLDGGTGNDVLVGGRGNDTLFVDSAGDVVVEASAEGRDVVYSTVNYVLGAGSHVEVLSARTHADTAPLSLTGNELAQEIWGNAGANTLRGGGGADTLVGLGGNDTYIVENGSVSVIEASGGGARDTVYSSVDYALGSGQHIEVLSALNHAGTTALSLTGNNFAQEIWGNAGANTLRGGGGNDALIGLGGNDIYFVENAGVAVIEAAGGGARDVVYSSVDHALGTGQHVEVLSALSHAGRTALSLTGNELANEIWGNAGNNRLDGKGGNDTLIGQGGADMFAFTTALGAGNVDRIADFQTGLDKIGLDDAIFTGIGASLDASEFAIGTAAADPDDRIIYDSATGRLLFDSDGAGGAAAVQFATLSAGLSLTAGDFAMI